MNFALTFYPIDVATVSILMYVLSLLQRIKRHRHHPFQSLSWADTAASTVGRLFGAKTPRLPSRLPVLRLPLAPRKSVAGFIAATVTGTLIAIGFWGWVAPLRSGTPDLSWVWDDGATSPGFSSSSPGVAGATGGWIGLGVVGVVAGLVSGVAEALGTCFFSFYFWLIDLFCRSLIGRQHDTADHLWRLHPGVPQVPWTVLVLFMIFRCLLLRFWHYHLSRQIYPAFQLHIIIRPIKYLL